MVRNIATQDGIQAWHRLYRHCNRRTFARIQRMHREATHPKPVKDMEALISQIVEWEDRWNRMAKEHKDPLPMIWKMAALMELCPPEVQDMIYRNVDEVNEDYDKLKQKIVTWTSNKVANEGVPMDIGRVGCHENHDHDHDDYEISAIGQHTQCYNCGGWEHVSRECPSEKKGKEKGKDFGKGGEDSSKGGKDSGKGYQGACFNCGKVGHKVWECRSRRQVGAVDEENYGNDEGIGGVEINKVQKMEVQNDPKTKAIEISLDSGAGPSCWPAKLLKKITMKEKDKGVRFKAANGTEFKYYGTKNIKFQSEGSICDVKFHVTDTTKPLASAAAIAKMGNRVGLEDGLGKSYIENVATGKKIHLRESDGTYVLDADCLADAAIFSRRR